jgi:hypothetical protein
MSAITALAVDVGTSAACQALSMPRASYYRDRRKTPSAVLKGLSGHMIMPGVSLPALKCKNRGPPSTARSSND